MIYQYIYEPDRNKTVDIIKNSLNVLTYRDAESGSLESLQTELQNTQLFLANLVGILKEKELIYDIDWTKLVGQGEDK
jgi:hypothetical protein